MGVLEVRQKVEPFEGFLVCPTFDHAPIYPGPGSCPAYIVLTFYGIS